jgi:hypothetical protein
LSVAAAAADAGADQVEGDALVAGADGPLRSNLVRLTVK